MNHADTSHRQDFLHTVHFQRHVSFPVCRLGLATRGTSQLTADDVRYALDRGVNFLNWCGVADGLQTAIQQLGSRRAEVLICVQGEARTAAEAEREFGQFLTDLQTDYLDVLTFYYVEEAAEWQQLIGPGGALEYYRQAQRQGRVRLLGLTSHQRPLAAEAAQSGLLDLLMIRYNASHRGAETEVFPITQAGGLPVVVYTCLRWGALLRPTPEDPPGFIVPTAPAWYRFALQHPAVTVALMAPEDRGELEENLTLLDRPVPPEPAEYEQLAAHGRRVRKYGGGFP